MHRVLVRIKDVRRRKILEAYFDERLSLMENLKILDTLCGSKIGDARIYDPNKKIFLDRNIPLEEFGFCGFVFFHAFT